MNKSLLSLLGCSGSITAILATATVASPDAAKTIPYPQVMNLKQVPKFNYKGIIPQSVMAKTQPSQYLSKQKSQGSISAKVTHVQDKTASASTLNRDRASEYLSKQESNGLPSPIGTDVRYKNVSTVALDRIGCDCPICRNPTRGMMMRLGT
jgi:hypothetical protein